MPQKARLHSTYVDFRTVKAAVSFEAVLEHYDMLEDLDPKDDGYTGDCPFHEGESRRPFHVSLTKNAWYCFGCEEGGNVLDFVARMEDVSIKRAAELLAEWFEIGMPVGARKRPVESSGQASAGLPSRHAKRSRKRPLRRSKRRLPRRRRTRQRASK